MLKKLLKYDFIDVGKVMTIGYSVLLILALTTKLFSFLSTKLSIFSVPLGLSMMLYIIALVGSLLFTILVIIRNFYISFYKDEAYLTNTLPVKRESIYFSKLIMAFVYFLITMVVMVGSILIVFYSKDLYDAVIALLNVATNELDINIVFIIVLIFMYMIISYMQGFMMIITSCILGHSFDKNRITNSIVAGVILYFIGQMSGMISLGISLLIDNKLLKAFINASEINARQVLTIIMTSMAICLVMIAAYILIGKRVLNKKYNLE